MSESALPRDATVADTLEALARRCEIERPDRGLDLDIGTAMGWRLERSGDSHFADWFSPEGETGPDYAPPYYTTSLDSAVTLVPEDCGFKIETDDWDAMDPPCPLPPSVYASVHDKQCTRHARKDSRSPRSDDRKKRRGIWAPTHHNVRAATPALALCAAALRARAALAREADTHNGGDK